MTREGEPQVDFDRMIVASTLKLYRLRGVPVSALIGGKVPTGLDSHRIFNRHHVIGVNMDGDRLTDEAYR